ncbi:DUF6285 domain-containing protein [Caulobacter sp. DWP3-1-3b2]|uniref:DUF6285 domain-containing protein n=1 Tax=Caulobacter sp. DWP3-1-3b2 TaxID=2804643 RepID=UPI003CE8118B
MIANPTAAELLAAVADWLGEPDDGNDFARRVALNAVNIVRRELDWGAAMASAAQVRLSTLLDRQGSVDNLTAALAAAIRDGAVAHDDPALMAHLKQTALDQLAIDQPRYRHALTIRVPETRS